MTQGAPQPGPQQPGWYPDPWNPHNVRWFDGRQWSPHTNQRQQTPPSRGRTPIIGPLLILAGIAAAMFLALAHPSVSVPLAGTQDCGATSLKLGTSSLSNFQDATSSQLAAALDQECINKGRTNLYYGVGAAIVGLIAGTMVLRYEQSRN